MKIFEKWYQTWFSRFENRHAKLTSAKSGWDACKKEVLKKLRSCEDYYEDRNGSDDYRVGESVFKEIEKL